MKNNNTSSDAAPKTFTPGGIYFATLTCAHSSFPVRVIRRTAKSIWIEPADEDRRKRYPVKRCAVRSYGDSEYASAWSSWHLAAYSTTDNGFDMQTI